MAAAIDRLPVDESSVFSDHTFNSRLSRRLSKHGRARNGFIRCKKLPLRQYEIAHQFIAMNQLNIAFLLVSALVVTACSRTPDTAPVQQAMTAGAAVPAVAKATEITEKLPGKILNQKMPWPEYTDLKCVPAPSHFDRTTTKRFETVRRLTNTLRWETMGRYPKETDASSQHHVADFTITPGVTGDMRLIRDDSPRPSYRSDEINFPLSASAIKNFTLVSYLNESGRQEAHFMFDVTLVSHQGVEKIAAYHCVSDDYESNEDSKARQVADAAQKRRAWQIESLERVRQAGGKCDAIAADMETAMNAQDDAGFAGRHEAALYYGCLR